MYLPNELISLNLNFINCNSILFNDSKLVKKLIEYFNN